MFAAITTKFLPQTNTRPNRIKAISQAGSYTVSAYGNDSNERNVALAYAKKLGWIEHDSELVSGRAHDGTGYHVLIRESNGNG
jgi:hypothetical protein